VESPIDLRHPEVALIGGLISAVAKVAIEQLTDVELAYPTFTALGDPAQTRHAGADPRRRVGTPCRVADGMANAWVGIGLRERWRRECFERAPSGKGHRWKLTLLLSVAGLPARG
jgi:hypothetical protein